MNTTKVPRKHLLLIRHGRPLDSGDAGADDPPLDEVGEQHAQRVARRLISEGLDGVVASPMQRARATALPTANALSLDIQTVENVAEVDYHSGAKYVSVDRLRRLGGEAWDRLLADPVTALGGDPVTFRQTVLAGLQQLLNIDGARKIAVFTHGLPINVALSHCLGNESLTQFIPHYGSITRIVGSTLDDLRVISINETGHFPPDELRLR